MEKIKQWDFIQKGSYTKIKIFISIIISIGISFGVCQIRNLSLELIPIFFVILLFGCFHLIFKLDKMYELIYKFRYVIALIVLVYAVMMEYNFSSIGIYDKMVQPNCTQEDFSPLLGQSRIIRADEYVVNTPLFISQVVDNSDKQFAYYNNNARGTMTDMFSVVNPPVKDVLTLGKIFNFGYILFGAAKGTSIVWVGKWIALIMVSFEFFMLLTDKKKVYSLFGMILIVCSAAMQWWNSTELLIWGMLALMLIDKFMTTKKTSVKILCCIGLFISAISYIFIFYPAWQIPYGYVFLALAIWIFLKNKPNYQFNIKDIVMILVTILLVGAMLLRYYDMSKDAINALMNTDYPGERLELGGNGETTLFSYVYSMLFPYIDIFNPCEPAGMTSYYPIPMLMAAIYLWRNRKNKEHRKFIIPLLIIDVIFSIWAIIQTNELFAKITLLYMVPAYRLAVPLGLTQIYLMVYMLAHVKEEDKLLGKNLSKVFAIVLSIAIMYMAIKTQPATVMEGITIYVLGLILLAGVYWITTMNQEKSRKCLIAMLIIISFITATLVNPLQKGIGVLTEKPLSKKVQEIVEEDSQNNLWMVVGQNTQVSDYLLASGAKIINSTNFYPNQELFDTILGEESQKEENRKIYNRYAHIIVKLTNEDSRIELVVVDSIRIYLNVDKVKDLGVNYIYSTEENLEQMNTKNVQFEKIYQEDGAYIYKVND